MIARGAIVAAVLASATPAAAQMYTEPSPVLVLQPVGAPGGAAATLRNPATMNTMVNGLLAPPCNFTATFDPPLPWQIGGVGQFGFGVTIGAIDMDTTEQCSFQIVDTIGVGGYIHVRVVVGAGGGISAIPDPIAFGDVPIGSSVPQSATAYNDTALVADDPLTWDWRGADGSQFRLASPCDTGATGTCTSPSFGPSNMMPFEVRCEPDAAGPKASTLAISGLFGGTEFHSALVGVTCNSDSPGPDADTGAPDADPEAPDADPDVPDGGSGAGLDTRGFYACGCNGDTGRGTGLFVALALLVIFRRSGSS